MNISGISSNTMAQQIQQSQHAGQRQSMQPSSSPDGDGDHGVEPHKGQHINALA